MYCFEFNNTIPILKDFQNGFVCSIGHNEVCADLINVVN